VTKLKDSIISLSIQSLHIYLQLDMFLNGMHELSYKTEAVRSDAIVVCEGTNCGLLWKIPAFYVRGGAQVKLRTRDLFSKGIYTSSLFSDLSC
jgi:hypothetical protein